MNRKKLLGVSALLSILASTQVMAANITEQQTTVTTQIEPEFTVSIPTDKEIPFGALSTELGKLTLTRGLLELDHVVRVTAAWDGNLDSGENKLPYALCADGEEFSYVDFEAENEFISLTVDITQDAWRQAYAGSYSDTITFQINYMERQEDD